MMLMCESRVTIQWMIFSMYIAYGIAGFTLWPIPDKMGRRFTFSVFGFLHLTAQWIMLLCPIYWVRLSCFIAMGACCLKNNICYTWLFELTES